MHIVIITSCTGEKTVDHKKAPVLADFHEGNEHLEQIHQQLDSLFTPAKDLYSGQQHVRLMRGIEHAHVVDESLDIDLYIVSAGYGLVPGDKKLPPYEVTFSDMGKREIRTWADHLNIPNDFRKVVKAPYDLALILLGDNYLAACDLDAAIQLGGPTLFFCGSVQAKKFPMIDKAKVIPLKNSDATTFSCGLVGLKGELAGRLLKKICDHPNFLGTLTQPETDILKMLADTSKPAKVKPNLIHINKIDRIITLNDSWKNKLHRHKLRYFIPEWDDLVDPDYNFEEDIHSGGSGDWSNEVYAHQMYPEPNYDGILVSRAVAEKSKKKNDRINAMGVHRYLRVPREFPIMGDCGAFDYIEQKEPPYTTADVIDYYTRLDFDFGVSVDHLIVKAFESEKQFRYDLTIHNAEDLLKEHRKMGLSWEPIGAVQGWDPHSYAKAVDLYQKMGYRTIALGGLVRSTTKEIYSYLEEIKKILKSDTRVHLFGIARPEALGKFSQLGVTSVDSASHLRRAWLVAKDNYFTLDGNSFSAIRIPDVEKSFRAKRIVRDGKADKESLIQLEKNCLRVIRDFDKGKLAMEATLNVLDEYDQLISEGRIGMREEYRRTLIEKPWKQCPCDICKDSGVEVMIFRGNNRNRRRGFHNTYIFYRLMQQSLLNEDTVIGPEQLSLFQ